MKRKAMLMTLGVVCAFAFVGSAAIGCNDTSGTEEPEKFTVTYARGATDATGDIPEVSSYAEGESFALLPSDTFARVDYDFKCWSYGGEEYDAGAQFTMPADNVTFTAVWESSGGDTPDQPDPPPAETDDPTLTELGGEFYTASNWAYMTNDGGTSTDGGDKVYALDDGSVKFHRANQSVLFGDQSNRTMSFMLKGTNDWSIWFNSSSKDNADNYSYRLAYAYGGLRLVVSSAPEQAAAVIDGTGYKKGEWNRFDVAFETTGRETSIKVYINGKRAALTAGDNASPAISVADNVLTHTRPAMFETGNYVCVKVWEAHNYVQIKPVAKADEEDVPVIACIGASITEGAGAGNFYTESYPAQLQNSQGGTYNVINFGNSGKTVNEDMTEDGKPVGWLKQNQWTGVQAIKPDIAIINMGTNDSKTTNDPVCTHDTFKADYENLLTKLLGVNPDMRIYICTVPYAYSSIYGISNDNIRDIIAPVQREIAQEKGYPLIDLYEYTQGKSLLFGDGVHPNTTGYAMFVEIIDKVLEEGAEGLTPEFRAYIDEKYNDPEFELTNVHGGLAVSDDAINLTVTGNIEMDDVSNMRLVVETGVDGEEREVAIVPDANGDFTATMNIATLTSTKYYNVRVYLTETYYYFLRLTDTEFEVGQKFNTSSREVTVRSWTSGGEPTFSFTVGDYNQLELTSATITESNGTQILTVVGKSGDSGIRLYIGADPADTTKYNEYKNIAVGADGAFTATFDLSELPVGGWYNARLYFTDGTYVPLSYATTTNGTRPLTTKDYFLTDTTKIDIVSWGDGGTPTLSFSVSAYSGEFIPELDVTSITITESNGAINLSISGTTNDEGLRLYVGNSETNSAFYHGVTYDDGAFTVTFDLATLAAGGGWYDVRLYYNADWYDDTHTDYYSARYTDVRYANGEAVAVDDVLHGTTTKVTIKSWATWNPLSLFVEEWDSTVSFAADSVEFKDGNFVLKGTSANIDHLYVYLINTNVAGSENNYVEAVIASDGTYTATLPLATLLGYAKTGTPFNLRYKINDTSVATVNIAPDNFDMSQIGWSGVNCFYLGTNNGCTAVYYRSDAYGFTKAEIVKIDDKATLVMEGTLSAGDTAANTVWLLLDETGTGTGKQKILVANDATAAGTFKFAVDVSRLEASTEASTSNGAASRHYYIRLYIGNDLTADNYTSGTKLADVNSRWLADKLFGGISVVGDSSEYFFIRNNTSRYDTLGIVRVGKDGAFKLGDIDDVALGYYAKDSVMIDLSRYVDANGTAVTYTVSANESIVDASETGGILTVSAAALSGSTTVTVEVASDGTRAFELAFDVTVSDTNITETHNYQSFLSADSWLNIVDDGNDRPRYDSYTNSVLLQWGNVYQEIGATEHISFELWVNGSGKYGFELWLRSTVNSKTGAGGKYVMNGYGDTITISRESGGTLASFPRFAAGTFTRFDVTFFDAYTDGALTKTTVNVYQSGVKVASFTDNNPIAPQEGIYFGLKSWEPQIAIRVAEEFPNPDAVRVATVGDSITYGHTWHEQSYPAYLANELGDDYSVGNFGLNGASVTGFGGSSLKYSAQTEYNNSIAFAPSVIVIMLGTNDANGWANASAVYESELRALIAAYRTACPDAEILLVTSAPTLDNNSFGIPNDVIRDSVNPIQRSVAADLGLTLVDLREKMENAEGGYTAFFREDGVHLSESGAQFVSGIIADAVKAL